MLLAGIDELHLFHRFLEFRKRLGLGIRQGGGLHIAQAAQQFHHELHLAFLDLQ